MPSAAARRSPPPTRTARCSSPPMPAPARPTCWCSASSTCCCAAKTRPRSSASPSPRRRRQHGDAACSRRWPSGPRSTTRALDEKIRASTGKRAGCRAARAGAAAVCQRAGKPRRAQGADHPRLLHAAAASVSVRGRRCRALRGARRRRPPRNCSTNSRLDVILEGACRSRRRARPGAGERHHRGRRHHLQGGDRRDHRASASWSPPGSNAPAASRRRSPN